jgi:tripartite-type tricarboxylate transporter receptor subunit TctC
MERPHQIDRHYRRVKIAANIAHRGQMAAAALAIVGSAVVAAADNYPNRVIKIIVPFGAGGQPDVVARVVAQYFQNNLGPTVVDNHPGGNTTLGAQAAAAAMPDGHTLLFGSSTSLAIAPALNPNAGYDPVKSFAPIAGISSSPMYLTIGPSMQDKLKAKTVGALIAYAKANPGKLNFAAPNGGPPHLAGEMFRHAVGIDIVPVFYGSMNQAFTDLLGGRMDIVFDSPAPLAPLLREGKITALVGLGGKRMDRLPDVPTMAQSGLPDLRAVTWNGLVAPAGIPAALITRLNGLVNDALRSEEIREILDKFSSEPLGGSPQEFADFIAAESRKWSEIIRLSGVRLEQ